jgi:hypothetical protein
MRDGVSKCEVLTTGEVEAIRKRSKAGSSGPWVTDWSEMAKKTAFRRVSKWLPLSAEVQDAFERDDDKLIDAVSYRAIESKPRGTEALESTLGQLLSATDVVTENVASVPQSKLTDEEKEAIRREESKG